MADLQHFALFPSLPHFMDKLGAQRLLQSSRPGFSLESVFSCNFLIVFCPRIGISFRFLFREIRSVFRTYVHVLRLWLLLQTYRSFGSFSLVQSPP